MEMGVKNINHHQEDIKDPELLKKQGFGTEIWYYSLGQKIKHLIHTLEKHLEYPSIKYFIFSDCDVMFIRKNFQEWYNLEEFIQNQNKDIYFMEEIYINENDVNSGFFIILNNPSTIPGLIQFFQKVSETMQQSESNKMPFGDQSIINQFKYEINFGYIPNDYVIYGTVIFNPQKSLIHHAVCCPNLEQKIDQINWIQEKICSK